MKNQLVFGRRLAILTLVLAFSFCKKMETPAPPPDPIDPPDPVSVCAGKNELPVLLGWKRDSIENPVDWFGFTFVSEKKAFTFDGRYFTNDGGKNWQNTTGLFAFLEIIFPDSLNGFALTTAQDGGESYLFKTDDGGLNWSKKTLAGEWSGFHFLNEKEGIAIKFEFLGGPNNSKRGLFRTFDGGETWSPLADAPAEPFKADFSKAEDRRVLIVQSVGEHFKSNDFGATWSKIVNPIRDPSGESETAFEFLDAQNGIAFLLQLERTTDVHETNDGGKTWHRIDGGRRIMDAEYLGPNRLLALELIEDGYPSVCARWIETTDGGQSWSSSPIWSVSYDDPKERIFAFGPNRVFYYSFSKIVENGAKRRFYWLTRQ